MFATPIPTKLLDDPKTNVYDTVVYAAIARFAQPSGSCSRNINDICLVAHCCRMTTIKAIRHLEELGYVTVDRSRRTSSYHCVFWPESDD